MFSQFHKTMVWWQGACRTPQMSGGVWKGREGKGTSVIHHPANTFLPTIHWRCAPLCICALPGRYRGCRYVYLKGLSGPPPWFIVLFWPFESLWGQRGTLSYYIDAFNWHQFWGDRSTAQGRKGGRQGNKVPQQRATNSASTW